MIRKILKFKNNGGQEKRILFEDLIPKAHQYMFAFVAKDLASLILETEKYLASSAEDEDLLGRILSEMQALHPVYDDSAAVISLLARTGAEYIRLRGEDESGAVAEKLMERGIADRATLSGYLSEADREGRPVPDSLYSLEEIQGEARTVLTIVLDKTDPYMERMDRGKKNILACLVNSRWADFVNGQGGEGRLRLYVEEGVSLPDVKRFSGLNISRDAKMIGAARTGRAIPMSIKNLLSAIPDSESGVEWCYELSGIEDLFEIELMEMVRDEVPVKRCRKCGRYFVYEPDGYEYCIIKREEDGGSCYSDNMVFVGRDIYKRAYKAFYQMLLRGVVAEKWFNAWHVWARDYIYNEVDYTAVSAEEIKGHLDALRKKALEETKRERASSE